MGILDNKYDVSPSQEFLVGEPALRDYRKELWSSAFVALLPSATDSDFNGDVSAVVRVLSAVADAALAAFDARFPPPTP